MKINFKIRFKNRTWLVAFLFALIEVVYRIAQLFGYELPIEMSEAEKIAEFFVGVLVALGVVIDPTTKGVNDSERAMMYEELG